MPQRRAIPATDSSARRFSAQDRRCCHDLVRLLFFLQWFVTRLNTQTVGSRQQWELHRQTAGRSANRNLFTPTRTLSDELVGGPVTHAGSIETP